MTGASAQVGVFGGSGFYRLLDDVEHVEVDTPYGPPSDRVAVGLVGGVSVAFLPRHGGGHTLPPDEVALEAIEWMELQAMKSGRRTRDAALIDRLFEKRQRVIAEAVNPAETVHLLEALVSDFTSLHDVTAEAKRLNVEKTVSFILESGKKF